ncbi:hypothetical protein CRUP_002274 [Coryphaenoides rupestris]|nr:hypothetical protein CRUP_002274 [Coryphaenoides rupestris]
MQKPAGFSLVLYTGMTVVTLLYISLGTVGYMCFGKFIAGSITLNLPNCCHRWKIIVELVMKAVLVIFTCALAVLIPELDLVISLVGSVSSSFLALIFPPLLELLSFHTEGVSPLVVIKNVAISVVGLVGFITGTYVAIEEIVARTSK